MTDRGAAYYENLSAITSTTTGDEVDALLDATAVKKPSSVKTKQSSEYFLSDVPVRWLRRVFELRSSDACKVAGMLLLERSFHYGDNVIRGTEKASRLFGLTRQARHRGMKKLEGAKLLKVVEKSPGSYTKVELLGVKGTNQKRL